MTLAFYIARRFLRGFLMVAGVFGLILFLIEMIETIRRFAGHGLGLAQTAGLAALNIASSFYSILPLITVLAAITLFLGLARSSEMVAIRASGRSALRMLRAPVATVLLLGALSVAVLNPFVAATGKRYDREVAQIRTGGQQTVSLGDQAVWLRQGLIQDGTASGQLVIRAARASADATTLYDASFLIFDAGGSPTRRIEAARAVLTPGAWQLDEVHEYRLTLSNPETAMREMDSLSLESDLTAQRIRDGFGQPDAVPVWQLPAFIAGLERAGFAATRHRVWFQMELARPALMATMVLIAAAFTMRHLRGRSAGAAVLMGFGGGVALFFLRNMAQVLGDNGEVAPWLAAWTPPAIAAALALAVILQREDG